MIRKEWFNILLLVFFVVFALYFHSTAKVDLSGNIIIEYDVNDKPVRTESPFVVVWLIPIAAAAFYLILVVLAQIEVYKPHLERFFERFFFFKFIMLLLLLAIYLSFILANRANNMLQIALLYIILGLAFLYIAHLFDHLRSDYFAPWIKGRSIIWEDTHFIGTWLFRICAFIVLFGFFWPDLALFFVFVPLFCIILMIILYSFIIFKKEHEHDKAHVHQSYEDSSVHKSEHESEVSIAHSSLHAPAVVAKVNKVEVAHRTSKAKSSPVSQVSSAKKSKKNQKKSAKTRTKRARK